MGFFEIFKKTKSQVVLNKERPFECEQILDFSDRIDNLKQGNHYVARSEYLKLKDDCNSSFRSIETLVKTKMISEYCHKYNVDEKSVYHAIDNYNNTDKIIKKCNEDYICKTLIKEKDYLDNVLKEVDPVINLDENQRKVVLTDEDYCLVIAGAGAGKTTTVAAKVKYLVEKKAIDPKEILVISFTNKAVNELKDKINENLEIPCTISTFHAIGNAILRKDNNEKMQIAQDSMLYYTTLKFLKNKVLNDESLTKKLVLFFSTYFDIPKEYDDVEEFLKNPSKAIYTSLKSDLGDYNRKIIDARSKRSITIQNEILRSHQEVVIANFLYLNGIDYEYEAVYNYDIKYANKPYTPDFKLKQNGEVIYLEHVGISESGYNSLYSKSELESYKKSINDKVTLHRKHGTKLIYTFSSYNDSRSILEHLKEQLLKNGFILKPRSDK